MNASKVKQSYRTFCETFTDYRDKGFSEADAGGLLFIWGSEDYLIYRCGQLIKKIRRSKGLGPALLIDSSELKSPTSLDEYWQEKDLFSDQACYMFSQAEKLKTFGAQLKRIPSSQGLGNTFIFLFKGKSLSSSLQKELKRLNAFQIPCFAPRLNEMSSFIKHLSKDFGISLHEQARALILESLGEDLFKLENEIKKLSLMFPNRSSDISAEEVAPALGLLRQDHAFRLSRLLCQKESAKALDLALNLLGRGESAIALTGVIARHIRTAIQVSAPGGPSGAGRVQVRLPWSVQKDYQSYVRDLSRAVLLEKLKDCQLADMQLKGFAKIPEDLIVTRLLTGL